MSKERYGSADLQKFKDVQSLAYEAVANVEKSLDVGVTEIEAAARIESFLRARGVKRFFHHGFAWFGDRTAFRGFLKPKGAALTSLLDPRMMHFGKQFMPSERRLREGDAVILDVAPVVDGVAADIGYSCAAPGSPEVHAARMALEPYRELVLRMVREGKTQGQIYRAVDAVIADQGYENAHSYYPGSVLAHRIGKLPMSGVPLPTIQGFDLQALLYLSEHLVRSAVAGAANKTPLWNLDSDAPCEPGLWAVEPHIAKGPIGAKWEEILVVTEDTAYWLDDDLPHVRYWNEHGSGTSRRSRAA